MQIRQPVVTGRFYPGQPETLRAEAQGWLGQNTPDKTSKPWAVMLPHAGYVYCGNVIGATLINLELPKKVIILCPNHTGRGQMLGVWPDGAWLTPLGPVKVASSLASEIINSGGGFSADPQSHLLEHSIEVLLPFLQLKNPEAAIVPICVGVQNPQILAAAGKALASVLNKPENRDTGLIVSSDMNHYESETATIKKDELALKEILADNPDGLLDVVRKYNITMCGAGPMALALYTAKYLGKLDIEIVTHDTSATACGDHEHTVGYAGARFYLSRAS